MEVLNLSDLNGETIHVLSHSIKKQEEYWFDDVKKFYTDGDYIISNSIIFGQNRPENIYHMSRFYCMCVYKEEFYVTSFGKLINDLIMKLGHNKVFDIKIGTEMIDVYGRDKPLVSYEKSVVSISQLPLENFIEISGKYKEEIDFYMKNGYLTHVPKWYDDKDFMDNLIKKGFDVYDIILKVRENNINKILNND